VPRTVLELHRRVLLTTSSTYGLLAAAVPTSFVAHRHLVLTASFAAAIAAAVLVLAVLWSRDLGHRRGRLASTLLLIGPLGPVWLARRTRRWQPLLLVRPRPSRR
jgi:hypothetical protein